MNLDHAAAGLDFDVGRLFDLLDQVMRHGGRKRFAAHQHNDFVGEFGKMHGSLTGGICAADDMHDFTLAGHGLGSSAAIIYARALQTLDAGNIECPPLHSHSEEKRVAGNLEAVGELEETVRTFRAEADGFLRSKNLHAESASLGHGAASEIVAAES